MAGAYSGQQNPTPTSSSPGVTDAGYGMGNNSNSSTPGVTDAGSGGPLQNNPHNYLYGLWMGTIKPSSNAGGNQYNIIQNFLKNMGYKVNVTGVRDHQTHQALHAYLHGVHTSVYNKGIGGGGHHHSGSGGAGGSVPGDPSTNQTIPSYGDLSAPSWQKLLGNIDSQYLNPQFYAQNIANQLYNPEIDQLTQQGAATQSMMPKIQAAIDAAYGGVQNQANARAGQDQASSQAAAQGIASVGTSLANALGLGGSGTSFANMMGNAASSALQQGANNANQARSDATALSKQVAGLKTQTANQYNNKYNAIQTALGQARTAKAQEYAKQFVNGLGLRNSLIAGALANRGAILNQDELAKMGGLKLSAAALGLQQGVQNLNAQANQINQSNQLFPLQLQQLQQSLQQAGVQNFAHMNASQRVGLGNSLITSYLYADPTTGQPRLAGSAADVVGNMVGYLKQLFPKDNAAALQAFAQSLVSQYH